VTFEPRLRPWLERGVYGHLTTRLGVRLLVWFLLLSLVPLLISNTIGYLQSRRIIEDLLAQSLEAVSLLNTLHAKERVERHILFLNAVAAGNAFLAAAVRREEGRRGQVEEVATREAVAAYLARQWPEGGAFTDLFLMTLDGVPIATSHGGEEDFPCTGRTSNLSVVRGAGPPHICVTVPVTDIEGRKVGLFGGFVAPDRFPAFFQIPAGQDNRIHALILDETGRPLISSGLTDLDFTRPFDTPLRDGGPGSLGRYRNALGVEVAGRRTSIPGLPWTQVTEVPVEDALRPLRTLRRASAYLAAVFVAIVVGAAWLVSGGIVAPVHRLVEATRRLGAGDRETRVEGFPPNEIGEMAQAFNDMAAELSRTSERVDELHRKEIERAHQLATVGELAGGIAHEIRNPMVGISNGMDLVRRRIGSDASLEPIMDEVEREIERVQGAIRDLLAFARPAEPRLSPSDGNAIVERAFRLVQPSADRKGVVMDLRTDLDLPLLLVDGEMLRQAFVNVLLNAVQATPAGGRVSVSTKVRDGRFVAQVADTGVGIPEERREEVFKPFYTTRHSGTGLGLSVTREVIQRHGGVIVVLPGGSRGSVFEIQMPLPDAGGRAP
jgi:signal transduction histidine kinase